MLCILFDVRGWSVYDKRFAYTFSGIVCDVNVMGFYLIALKLTKRHKNSKV